MDGSAFTFLARGAIIQHFEIHGIDIVQGFPTTELYESHNDPYFGETIGRFANRIQGASIKVPGGLNGKEAYPLTANNGANALHGGVNGWGKKTWDGPSPVGVNRNVPGLTPATLDKGGETVRFTLVSPDGDEGYPGTVNVSVSYSVGKQTLPDNNNVEATVLVMEYEAELVDGADETVINMTNHRYVQVCKGNDQGRARLTRTRKLLQPRKTPHDRGHRNPARRYQVPANRQRRHPDGRALDL